MISYEHETIWLFGIPLFTLVIGISLFVALAGLCFGLIKWRSGSGKVVACVSAFILLLFAVATMLVLITVGSGSMG